MPSPASSPRTKAALTRRSFAGSKGLAIIFLSAITTPAWAHKAGKGDVGHKLIHDGGECLSSDVTLGSQTTLDDCADACAELDGSQSAGGVTCTFFIYSSNTYCYMEETADESCSEGFDVDDYKFYQVQRGWSLEHNNGECLSSDKQLADQTSIQGCAAACAEETDPICNHFIYRGDQDKCYAEYPSNPLSSNSYCSEGFDTGDGYDYYRLVPLPQDPLWSSDDESVCTVVADDDGNPGRCVVDSGGESGNYGNSESCTMTALIGMTINSVGTFSTESISYDYLKLGQSPSTKWGGSTGPSDVDMAADDTMVRSPARARHHHHHTAIARSSMLILIARSHLSHVPSHLTMADVAVGLVWKLRGLEDLRHETRTTSSATPANPAANPAVSASVATAQCASDLGVRRWLGVRHVLYDRTSGKLPEGL